MSNSNIPAGPWSLEAGRSITTPAGTFYMSYGRDSYGRPNFRDFVALDNIARAVTELPALLEALGALYARADMGLDQSATHDGLANCDALAKARAALDTVNRSN